MNSKRLYHGTHKNFDHFVVSEELALHDLTSLAEGYGIYMTEDFAFAKSYGTYIHEILLPENLISDMTNVEYVNQLIENVGRKVGVGFNQYFDVEDIVQSVVEGFLSVTQLYKELNDMLDSQESFYSDFGDQVTNEEDCIFEKIKEAYLSELKDVIKYYDKTFKIPVYICFRNPEILPVVQIHDVQ